MNVKTMNWLEQMYPIFLESSLSKFESCKSTPVTEESINLIDETSGKKNSDTPKNLE